MVERLVRIRMGWGGLGSVVNPMKTGATKRLWTEYAISNRLGDISD